MSFRHNIFRVGRCLKFIITTLAIFFTLQKTLLRENIYKIIHMKNNFEKEKKLHSIFNISPSELITIIIICENGKL